MFSPALKPLLFLFTYLPVSWAFAQSEVLPDFSESLPGTTYVEMAKIAGSDTHVHQTMFGNKEFHAKFREYLGKGWGTRKLKTPDMMIAAIRGRARDAEANLVVFVNPAFPGIEIRKVHLKPKGDSKTMIVELSLSKTKPQ